MSKCVARNCDNEGWAAEPVLGATFCFGHWDAAKASFFKDGFRLKDTYPYGGRNRHRDVKVYFLASKRYIKIGSSVDPRSRITAFRSGDDETIQPEDLDRENLECIGWIRGWHDMNQRRLERKMHAKFAAHQVAGEWFHKSPQLVSEIKALILEAQTAEEEAA